MPDDDKAKPGLWVVISTPVADRETYMPHLPEHLRYIEGLDREGRIFAAGPLATLDDERKGRGLIILIAGDASSARRLADGDPLHRRGLRSYTLERWTVAEGLVRLPED